MTLTDVETRLRTDLPRLADAIVREPIVSEVVAVPAPTRRRRPTRAAFVAACVAIAVVVATVVVVSRDDPDSVPRPAGRDSIVTRRGWHALPPSSLGPRDGVTAVWTGDEVVVWGGFRGATIPMALQTGAAFDPRTGSWRDFSTRTAHPGAGAVWVGDRVVWFAKNGAIAFDPRTGAEREFPLVSGGGGSFFRAAVSTGSEALAVLGSQSTARIARFDERANEWILGAEHAVVLPNGDGTEALWTGDEVVIWDRGRAQGLAYAYAPATATWRDLPLPSAGTNSWTSLAWLDGQLVGVHASDGSQGRQLGIAAMSDGSWTPGRFIEDSGMQRPVAVTDGHRLAIVDEAGVGVPLLVDVATGTVERLEGYPLRPGAGTAAVWTPTGLFVWGGLPDGTPGTFDNPTPDQPEAAFYGA